MSWLIPSRETRTAGARNRPEPEPRHPRSVGRPAAARVPLLAHGGRSVSASIDWSLTPGRYVGVAPPKKDEDLDLEQTMRDIHRELAELNAGATELARRIQGNSEELGA